MVDRITSFVHTNQLINGNLRVQSRYAEGQVQLSTGYKSETFEGLAAESSRILNLESDVKRITAQTENAEIALNRTEVMFDALGTVIDIGRSFAADLGSAISGINIQPSQIQDIAIQQLEVTAAALNTQFAGRYVFSGSATQTAPVDLNAAGWGGAVIPSAADTGYYQGNSFIQSVEAADGFTLSYGLTADDTGLEQIIRAFDLVRTTPGDTATLQEALVLLQAGLDSVAETKARVSQDSQSLSAQIDQNQEDLTLTSKLITELKEVDLAEVSVRLQQLEAQLEASYSVTADLLRLSLTDFI
ncbi:MAG: flagellin [Bdellovibrionales bacterium]